MKKIKVASLFSGCGGMDLGFIGGFKHRQTVLPKTNFEIVFANDFDSDAVRTYQANKQYLGSHTFHAGDVREIPAKDVPAFDVLLAGFPCQPFSNAGNRQGVKDENGRGTLFYECERIIESCAKNSGGQLPKAFVFENVRGIMSSKMPDGRTVPEEIKLKMERLGFKVSMKLLRASDYGVPQRRFRFIIIGVRKDQPAFDFNSLDKIVSEMNLPSEMADPYQLTLGATLCDIPKAAPQAQEYWKYSPQGQRMVDLIGPCVEGAETLLKFKRRKSLAGLPATISQGKSWKNVDPDDLSPRFRKIHDDPKKYHAPNFYRRFALGEIAGTITASAQPENCGITHPFENRRMTIREIARIQSFPDNFVFPYTSIAGAYKVIGNAVPPIFAWVIARALGEHLERHAAITDK